MSSVSKCLRSKAFFLFLTFGLSVFLAGCEAVSFGSRSSFVPGPQLIRELSRAERADATAAMELALNAAGTTPARWGSAPNDNSGRVTPGTALMAGLTDGGDVFKAPLGIHVDTHLETALGNYRLVRNSNVRLGPTTAARRLTTLQSGTRVRALGRNNASNWYLIARNGRVVGYIYGPLMEEVRGGALVLAGGPTVLPKYCRAFTHDIRLRDGRREKWSGAACQRRNGRWEIAPDIGSWM